MVTQFGKFCRNLRMDEGELLYHMAKKLGVSSAFLSKVENGKAKPPVEWKEIIASEYQLDNKKIEELDKSISEARENVIKVDEFSQSDRDMMFAFARQLEGLKEEDREKWKKMLNI